MQVCRFVDMLALLWVCLDSFVRFIMIVKSRCQDEVQWQANGTRNDGATSELPNHDGRRECYKFWFSSLASLSEP